MPDASPHRAFLLYAVLFRGLIPIRVVALPVPAVGAHLLDAVLRLPAQLALGLGGVAPALGNVAGAARVDHIGDLLTAGLGENGKSTRKAICDHLSYLGIKIDDEANSIRGKDVVISTPDSKVQVMVIPTNEELAIARETLALV